MTDTAHVVQVPIARHLTDELRGLVGLPRPEAITAIKLLKTREMAAIGRYQIEHLGEVTGHDICAQLSALTDAIVCHLAERAFAKAEAPVGWQNEVGIFAVGGYGRGEMNPASDLDLLVLSSAGTQPEWLAKAWQELQTLLWDVKFQVGASQRALPELEHILEDDFVTGTAVIEQRPLLASDAITSAMGGLIERFRARQAVPFLRFKLGELAKRRAQAGASVFLMEPNLKSNPGCLRDVQHLRNAAWAVSGSRNLLSLIELDVITRADLHGVMATNDHLLALRSLLHFHHGRKQDVWQLADQVRIAQLFGYSDVSSLRAVEHFMRSHYGQVLHVHQMVDLVTSRLHALGHLGPKPVLIKSRKALTADFSSVQGQAHLANPNLWREVDPMVRLMAGCRAAQQADARLSFELQRAIRANLQLIDDEVRHDPRIAATFMAIIGDVGRVEPILKDMHNCGLLGMYLPEFGNLTCHMQFDSYHQYTVDEHTLIAIGNLDAVASGKVSGLPGMSRIFPDVARKDLLCLSLLLHDMGKYMGRGHVARGAIMVAAVAKRLGLTRDEEDFVYFLVDKHVALSDASRMRNVNEPAFLKAFAERIGSIANLDALYCMTWCDAKAVGEGIMTGWQEALLGELRLAVAAQLEGTTSVTSHHERLVAALAEHGIVSTEAEAFLAQLGGTYAHQAAPAEAVKHATVLAEQRHMGVGLRYELGEKLIQVTAAIPDRHGLLADVAATLCGHGFDVIDLRSWITEPVDGQEGIVLYSFRLATIYPAKVKEPEMWEKLRKDLLAAAAGTLKSALLLDRRRQAMLGNRPADSGFDDPAVKVEQRTSDHHTIVDVHTKDEVGLLAKLCRAIAEHGDDIGYTLINTMGDVAVDVFYVSRKGRKLHDDEAESLRQHLVAVLNLKAA